MTRRRIVQARQRAADLIEDVEFLISLGEWPERIAHRCGYRNVDTLTTALNRYGRRDLTARMQLLDRRSQTYRNSLLDDEDRKISALRNGKRR